MIFTNFSADYVIPRGLRPSQFKSQWTVLAEYGEAMGKFGLTYRTLETAVSEIINLLNLSPCEGSDQIPCGAASHDLLLAGVFVGGAPVLVRCMMVMSPKHGCVLKVTYHHNPSLIK